MALSVYRDRKRRPSGRRFFILAAFIALPLAAATPPSGMMANVYRLTEAAAVLDVCFESHVYKALPSEKSVELQRLSSRLGELVRAIGKHYGDEGLHHVFVATKARIATDLNLKLHVKNHYQYCGERLAREMETYVAENEALINGFLRKQPSKRAP